MAVEKEKNWLGIIAFTISLVSILIFALTVYVATSFQMTPTTSSQLQLIVGFVGVVGVFLELIAIGLGIGGLFQKSKKSLSVAGISIASATLLVLLGLALIGMATDRRQPPSVTPSPSIHPLGSSST
jgi:hypothetical protein